MKTLKYRIETLQMQIKNLVPEQKAEMEREFLNLLFKQMKRDEHSPYLEHEKVFLLLEEAYNSVMLFEIISFQNNDDFFNFLEGMQQW